MRHLASLTALPPSVVATLVSRLEGRRQRGRPWALSLERRVVVGCTSLRTNLTIRELAAVFAISRSQAQRIVADIVTRLSELARASVHSDRRWSWIVDGTLIPTRDHGSAAKSKNYRWSCNAQVLVRRADLHVVAVTGGGPGNRNDPLHYRGSRVDCASVTVAYSPMEVTEESPSW